MPYPIPIKKETSLPIEEIIERLRHIRINLGYKSVILATVSSWGNPQTYEGQYINPPDTRYDLIMDCIRKLGIGHNDVEMCERWVKEFGDVAHIARFSAEVDVIVCVPTVGKRMVNVAIIFEDKGILPFDKDEFKKKAQAAFSGLSEAFDRYLFEVRTFSCHIHGKDCTEKESIASERSKYKDISTAFFMFQYDSPEYIKTSVESISDKYSIRVLIAKDEPHTGVKSCKICKLVQISDFGIASLAPLNHNVFTEIGWMYGSGRRVILLLDESNTKSADIPFDLSDRVLITFKNQKKLEEGLDRELPPFIKKLKG